MPMITRLLTSDDGVIIKRLFWKPVCCFRLKSTPRAMSGTVIDAFIVSMFMAYNAFKNRINFLCFAQYLGYILWFYMHYRFLWSYS